MVRASYQGRATPHTKDPHMTYVTLAVTDLDRLHHALLLAKADYCCKAVNLSGARWNEALRNLNALQELYEQVTQALDAETVEA